MPSGTVRVGTRGSALALWQAKWVADRLTASSGGSVELVPLSTKGDEHAGPFTGSEERGLFTSTLEVALLDGRVDLVVHSLKDLPVVDERVPVAAVPLRDDPRDAIVSTGGLSLAELPAGSSVGTSSPRRAALVGARRPDIEVRPIRGNVDSRVRMLDEGRYDAIVLAAAGLLRLGLEERIVQALDPKDFPPAPGQGALAVQVRPGDGEIRELVAALDDPVARATTTAERACLAALGGGCSLPVGVHAWSGPGGLGIVAFAASVDGARVVRSAATGSDPEALGRAAAQALLAQGAAELLG